MQLALARIGSGLAKTTNDPTHNSLLADYYPVDVRPSVYSAHQASRNLGNFLGPLVAGIVGLYFTWRLPFFLFAIRILVRNILVLAHNIFVIIVVFALLVVWPGWIGFRPRRRLKIWRNSPARQGRSPGRSGDMSLTRMAAFCPWPARVLPART